MTNKKRIQSEILNGNLRLPRLAMRAEVSSEVYTQVEGMFSAMWRMYLLKGREATISTPYWVKRIGSAKAANAALKTLSVNGWIVSKSLPNNNWGEAYLDEDKLLEYVDAKQLANIRKFNKFTKYTPKLLESTSATITSLRGELLDTGLVREGFKASGNTKYGYDTTTMAKHKEMVVALVSKGIDKMIAKYPKIVDDLANYKHVGEDVVESLIYADSIYSGGERTNDPRGRNNRGDLDKIGNPVGFKIMRSLLTIPEENRNRATEKGVLNYYLFIAELNSFKTGTKEEKIAFGAECYDNATMPAKADHLDDMFENIWCERIYAELDTYFGKVFKAKLRNTEVSHYWSVPIEIDMSASVLGYIGILLNHKPFMSRCNMIGTTLTDAWAHDVITNRDQFKTIMRQCYGSQMTPDAMWDDMDIPYTDDEVKAFHHELEVGELAVANAFKDFLIQESNPTPEMTLHVYDDKPYIKCNKFFNVGEITTQFDLYDTATNSVRRIHHTDTKRIPDLKSFRRYFPTGLIHGLDSQVEDATTLAVYNSYGWVIDIHDALILCPEAADLGRDTYARKLNDIHTDRKSILQNYFRSIGVKASAIKRWKDEVEPLVEPFQGTFKCNPMVLK